MYWFSIEIRIFTTDFLFILSILRDCKSAFYFSKINK